MNADFTHAVLAFGANLRDEHGFTMAHAKALDALQAAEVVGIVDRVRLRHAFRFVYCVTPDEVSRFDDAFDRFFAGPEGVAQPDAPARRARPDPADAGDDVSAPAPPADKPNPVPDDADGGARGAARPSVQLTEAATAWQTLRARYSPGAGRSEPPVVSADGLDALLAAAGTLIATVRLGRARRWKPARNGPRFDLRRTLRAALRTGGDPVALHRLGPPRRNPRFVVLIDGSRSMAEHAAPSLQFAHALCRRTRRAHAFVFSTEMHDVTGALRDPRQAGRALRDLGEAWGGGTRIGANLTAFVRAAGARQLQPDMVVLIASDGLDAGEGAALERAMRALRRQSAAVIWLHPHAADPNFRPAAAGIRTALPFVTLLAAARDRTDFLRLARTLARTI
ncbi:MAG: von Willebrand factor [Candidatus Eremiobacteraeota bacterium]|nr:von Willebrand factor [Candidatus Eremiobacteraeota bacterium]